MFRILVGVVVLAFTGGCSGKPSRVSPPAIDSHGSAQIAIEEFDANHDGKIDGSELEKVPSIKVALARIDQNGDKAVSAEELAARIEGWKQSQLGILGFAVRVTLDGKPLNDATVTFTPEKFLGSHLKPAQGTTDSQGYTRPTIDDPVLRSRHFAGAPYGFYRVEISGSKPIPTRYNTQTTLGAEIAPDAMTAAPISFDLTSK
jgi:hypothetical protein